jgi:hypothetical protein
MINDKSYIKNYTLALILGNLDQIIENSKYEIKDYLILKRSELEHSDTQYYY